MTTLLRRNLMVALGAVVFMAMSATDAHAGGVNFSTIASNIITSIASLPSLLSGLAYMFGILLGVLGVLKIKDHVENPGQVALKDGAIRLAAGGGLFALPIIYSAMQSTVGSGGAAVTAPAISSITFGP